VGAGVVALASSSFAAPGTTGTSAAAGTGAPTLRTHHTIVAHLDVPAHTISVIDSMRVPGAVVSKGTAIRFLLHRDLEIKRVVVGEWEVRPKIDERWNPRNFWARPPYEDLAGFDIVQEVRLDLPVNKIPENLSIVAEYAGVIADSLHAPDESYARSFESTSGRIVAEGAFLAGSTFWVPWFGDHLLTFDLTVETPGDWMTVSQGRLEANEEGARRRMRWISEEPMQEIELVAGPYRMREMEHGSVRLMTFTYADTEDSLCMRYLDGAKRYLDLYSTRFGPYPFAKFALVENYWQSGLGMPSFTLLGDRVIRLPFILDTSYGHEILHNWWGNGVFVRETGGNWSEGLTTYCADYFAKEQESEAAAEDYRRASLLAYRDFALAGGKDFPLEEFRERTSAATQAVGYGKTMMVFHMLRRKVGDEAFDRSLRRFYEQHRFQESDWVDLRECFEEVTKKDLQWWFEQWTGFVGAPKLGIKETRVDHEGGLFFLDATITQTEPTFDLELPVRVTTRTAVIDTTFRVKDQKTNIVIPSQDEPLTFEVDPDCHVFRALEAGEIAPTISGVLGAPRTFFVIGGHVSAEMKRALQDVIREWGADSNAVVIEESASDATEAKEAVQGATWLLGPGPRADRLRASLEGGTPVAGAKGSVVLATRDQTGAVGVFLPASPDVAVAIARKIPHYSKYSYLVFDGTTNGGKGVWAPGESPLKVALRPRGASK
jgi:hypothetical protein